MRLMRLAVVGALVLVTAALLPSVPASADPGPPSPKPVANPMLALTGKDFQASATPVPVVGDPANPAFPAFFRNDTGTCLDLENGTGPYVLHWGCHWGANQKWIFYWRTDRGLWEITPYGYYSDCVDVERGTGPHLLKWPCQSSANQLWEMWTYDNTYVWLSPSSNRDTCLDAEQTGARKYALAWPCNGGANQHWRFYS